jgi:hypothetical protein
MSFTLFFAQKSAMILTALWLIRSAFSFSSSALSTFVYALAFIIKSGTFCKFSKKNFNAMRSIKSIWFQRRR